MSRGGRIPVRGAVVLLAALALSGVLLARDGPRPAMDRPIPAWPAGGGPAHIVALGTSLTAGNGWPDRLADALTACLDRPVRLSRVARDGAGSSWGQAQLDRVVALSPDAVLIEFTTNDADLRDGVGVARARAQHAAILSELGAALPEARLVLMTMSPVSGLRGLIRPRLAAHEAGYAALARDHGAGLVDLGARWRAADLPPPADGLHPDDAATAQVVDPALRAAFGRATGRDCG